MVCGNFSYGSALNFPIATVKLGAGECKWVLKNYCYSKFNIGYHYKNYEKWILPPTIKQHFWDAEPTAGEHITVYLPHISKREINRYFYAIRGVEFHIFHPEVQKIEIDFNILR
jgi:hypothetical protein